MRPDLRVRGPALREIDRKRAQSGGMNSCPSLPASTPADASAHRPIASVDFGRRSAT